MNILIDEAKLSTLIRELCEDAVIEVLRSHPDTISYISPYLNRTRTKFVIEVGFLNEVPEDNTVQQMLSPYENIKKTYHQVEFEFILKQNEQYLHASNAVIQHTST